MAHLAGALLHHSSYLPHAVLRLPPIEQLELAGKLVVSHVEPCGPMVQETVLCTVSGQKCKGCLSEMIAEFKGPGKDPPEKTRQLKGS